MRSTRWDELNDLQRWALAQLHSDSTGIHRSAFGLSTQDLRRGTMTLRSLQILGLCSSVGPASLAIYHITPAGTFLVDAAKRAGALRT